ncbi:DNA-binding protein [Saccharopolyspora sp. 5N102]|uniref:DNA-binding protein n=1 Tax=Saccharopolyspora sp. 5N102 TaxID=3375155 RepID=UPI0037A23F5D
MALRSGHADSGFPRGVGAPATRALNAAGYTELRQLDGVPAAELKKLHGMGPKALSRLQESLEELGLSLS